MANQNSDVSDVRPDAGTSANVSPSQLPIRGEKRIIPSPVSPWDVNATFENAYTASGQRPPDVKGYANTGRTQLVDNEDFNVHAALSPFVDYVAVRLPNRGLGGNGQPDGNPAVYRFLINPSQVQVNRTTLDGQAMTRAGWQIGVWGEDSLQISLTGKTAGQYFAFGLTDKYQPFTESYRNLEQLQAVFENNGYWFEGEQVAETVLGGDFKRRIIKMHSDVELIVGNFMWYGMFESLTLSQNASDPFLMNFQIAFIAWKERFRKGSPYPDTLHNDVKRGHDYGAWKPTALPVTSRTILPPDTPTPTLAPSVPSVPSAAPKKIQVPPPSAPLVPPAVLSARASYLLPLVSPTVVDSVPKAPFGGFGGGRTGGGGAGGSF